MLVCILVYSVLVGIACSSSCSDGKEQTAECHSDCDATINSGRSLLQSGATNFEAMIGEHYVRQVPVKHSTTPLVRLITSATSNASEPSKEVAELSKMFDVTSGKWFPIYILNDDGVVSQSIRDNGQFESVLVGNIAQNFMVGDAHTRSVGAGTYVDIGANIGDTSLPIAALLGGSRVLAVEPRPLHVKLMQASFVVNGMDGVTIYPYGLVKESNKSVGSFTDNSQNAGGSHLQGDQGANDTHSEDVQLTTLDALYNDYPEVMRRVRVLKIDTEGHEGQVILGGDHFFQEHAPCYVYVEFTPEWMKNAGTPFTDVLTKLRALYDIYDQDFKRYKGNGTELPLSSGSKAAQYNWKLEHKDLELCLAKLK